MKNPILMVGFILCQPTWCDSIQQLIDRLSHASPEVQETAARQLGELGQEAQEAVPQLRRLISTASRIHYPSTVQQRLAIGVGEQALRAILKIAAPSEIRLLLLRVVSRNNSIRHIAIEALQVPEHYSRVLRLTTHRDPRVQQGAVRTLGELLSQSNLDPAKARQAAKKIIRLLRTAGPPVLGNLVTAIHVANHRGTIPKDLTADLFRSISHFTKRLSVADSRLRRHFADVLVLLVSAVGREGVSEAQVAHLQTLLRTAQEFHLGHLSHTLVQAIQRARGREPAQREALAAAQILIWETLRDASDTGQWFRLGGLRASDFEALDSRTRRWLLQRIFDSNVDTHQLFRLIQTLNQSTDAVLKQDLISFLRCNGLYSMLSNKGKL